MKSHIYIMCALALGVVGCQTQDDFLEARSPTERQMRHAEPYSKEQMETIDEPAGANSQSEEGKENPFIQPKAGDTQQLELLEPLPPPEL